MSSPTPISTNQAPAAIGPYSQGFRVGDLLFLSGQLGLDPSSGQLKGTTVEEQTEQAIKNVAALLQSQGLNLTHVVKSLVFMKNIGDFTRFNEIYAKHFKAPFPARSTVEVSKLPKDGLVEIEVVAYCGAR